MKKIIVLFVCVLSLIRLDAQSIRNKMMDESANGKNLALFLKEVEKQYGVDFVFDESEVGAVTVTGVSNDMYLNTYLDMLLDQAKMKMIKVRSNVFFIIKEAVLYEFGKRNENYLVFDLRKAGPQQIQGVLKDNDSGEAVVGAQVVIPSTRTGVLTDINGYFQLKVPDGLYKLDIRFIGYETASYLVGFSPYEGHKKVNVSLLSSTMELQGVTVTAERSDKNVQALVPGVEKMGIAEIKKLPAFLGEVDPVKSLTTLPGVSTVGELSSGFNVRGGGTGQNLIMQDGAIIYNPTHLFGFFSAFNPDLISDVALYKGGGPARYGGRVSSVLDVKLRNGDASRHKVKGGVGLVSSRLSVEGPLVKNKSSYIVGGRISYSNWLLKATENIQLQNSEANFNDVTAKIFHRINENNFVSISGYRSYDDFRLASDSTLVGVHSMLL